MTTSTAPADTPLPIVAGRLGDDSTALPLVAVEIEAEIRGLVATTKVRQTFRNTHGTGIEATYIFPLPDRAGVTAFAADLADRHVDGELRERGQARQEYDAAVAAGHRAAIAEEDRSGVFTTRVGNLQPGEDAVITLTLTGPLAVDDGMAEFRFPLVVAPRYIAGSPGEWLPVGRGTAADTDAVPDASRITPPVLLPGLDSPVRLTMRVRLSGLGLAPEAIRSSLHAIAVTADGEGEGAVAVALHPGERLNRDVVLRFPVAGEVIRTIAVVAPDGEDPTAGTWQVTVVPPAARQHAARGRDVVVALDRSGSMGGWKMVAARRAAARVIDSLAASDRFAVLAFDSVTERPPGLTSLAPATDRARWAAIEWLARLEARGGTEMLQPLRTAVTLLAGLGSAGSDEDAGTDMGARDQFLILVTDGQVGAEDQILAAVAPLAGRTRIFTLGIDQAVNAGFLRRLAAAGAGRCELVESEGRLDEVMTSLHRRISPPLVTGLRIESATAACELAAGETAPARDPDLFPGAPCTLSGRWRATTPSAEITLTVVGDGGFREQVTVAAVQPHEAVRTCWARARVRDLEDRYTVGTGDPALAGQIVAVSLRHRVLSRFTAFVAVDRTRHADVGGQPLPVVQPVELPGGWMAASAPAPMAAGGAHGYAGAAPMAVPPPGSARPASPRSEATRVRRPVAASGKRRPAAGPIPGAPVPPVHGTPPGSHEFGTSGTADGSVLAAYAVRAEELFARVEECLASGTDCGIVAALVEELADDLASVGLDDRLVRVLRRLATALRSFRNVRAELAAARKAFAATATVAPSADGGREARRNWWRIAGR